MQRFAAMDGHRKCTVFLFYLSSHYLIYIFKSLCTSRDDYFENLGETNVLACKMFTSGCRPWLKNLACLSSLISFHGFQTQFNFKCWKQCNTVDMTKATLRNFQGCPESRFWIWQHYRLQYSVNCDPSMKINLSPRHVTSVNRGDERPWEWGWSMFHPVGTGTHPFSVALPVWTLDCRSLLKGLLC